LNLILRKPEIGLGAEPCNFYKGEKIMKRISFFLLAIVGVCLLSGTVLPVTVVNAQEVLKYASSNQVFNAFEVDKVNAFTKATGIKMNGMIPVPR
jgi:hypothetical protein